MLSRRLPALLIAAFSATLGSYAFAGLNPSDHTNWIEDNGTYIGDTPPATAVEWATPSGFGAQYQKDGRVLSNAAITTNLLDGASLTKITTKLVSGQDANLYKVYISNPASFSISTPSTSFTLAIFGNDGTALAGSTGGGIPNAITNVNTTLPGAGFYYIGIGTSGNVPQNVSNQALFTFGGGVVAPNVLSDQVLGTDPYYAWTNPGNTSTFLLPDTSFLAGSSDINLSGVSFAVPEPASLGVLGLSGITLLVRRRRVAR